MGSLNAPYWPYRVVDFRVGKLAFRVRTRQWHLTRAFNGNRRIAWWTCAGFHVANFSCLMGLACSKSKRTYGTDGWGIKLAGHLPSSIIRNFMCPRIVGIASKNDRV